MEDVLKTPPVPGIVPAIRDLANRYGLFVISSSRSEPIREYLRRQDIGSVFADVMGGDVHRSKVEKMKLVLVKYGTAATNCLFVTDTLGDLEEATRAGGPPPGGSLG